MNLNRAIIAAVVALVAIMLWRAVMKTTAPQSTSPAVSTQPIAVGMAPDHQINRDTPYRNDTASAAQGDSVTNRTALIQNYVAQLRNDPLYEFKIPMRFYGAVLDESEHAVSDASVHFEWNNLNETNGLERKAAETASDAQGLFSFDGQQGKRLNVTVGKTGYYPSKQNPLAFEFADPANGAYYTPDAQNPVVFHLRKKGQGVPLITSKNGMRPDVRADIPVDGSSVSLDLLHQKISGNGQLQVSQSKPSNIPWQQATQWSFRLTIPDGGLIESHDEFNFAAPETGYEQTVDLNFQKGDTNWVTGFKKTYFIRFGTPPTYGILHVETSITDSAANFTYSLNPDGSLNLEPQ